MYNNDAHKRRRFFRPAWRMFTSVAMFAGYLGSLQGAVISIQSFGTLGNGVHDDSAAIQSAINKSAAGDTILFPSGTYYVSVPIYLPSNRTYQGQSAALKGPGSNFILLLPYDSAANITVDGLTLDGGGINTNGLNVPANNVRITNCTIQNVVSGGGNWTLHQGIFIPSGMTNSVIAQNQFTNIFTGGDTSPKDTDANAIKGYRLSNVSITDNVFNRVNQAIALQFDKNGPYPGVVIARNVGTAIHRMGIEIQGSYTTGMIVDSNQFSNFLNPFWNTFGLSIVADGGSDTVIRNNTVDAYPAATTGGRYGYGIEASGTRTQVTGNTIRNAFTAGIILGHGSNLTVTGNSLCGLSPGATTVGFEVPVQPGATISPNIMGATCRPNIAATRSAATKMALFSAGQLITVFGSELGPVVGSGGQLVNGAFATSNLGTRVLFDGVAAPIISSQGDQVSTVIPCELAGHSSVEVVAEYNGLPSDPVIIPLSNAAPGIYSANETGVGQGAILNQGYSANKAENPAARGSPIAIWATGFGKTTPECQDGAVYFDLLPAPVSTVSAVVGNQPAEVLYAGQAPASVSGVFQINIIIPYNSPTGVAVPITLGIEGRVSQVGVTVAIKP